MIFLYMLVMQKMHFQENIRNGLPEKIFDGSSNAYLQANQELMELLHFSTDFFGF
jgi:hypothetical protein